MAQRFAQIGEMTETLANVVLVKEQDIAIEDLETTTNEAADHIEKGQNELLKLWKNVSNDRESFWAAHIFHRPIHVAPPVMQQLANDAWLQKRAPQVHSVSAILVC